MATVKGVVRSYGAAVRRMERDQQRRAREAAKRFKEQQKLQAIEDAREAVEDYSSYVDMIQSVHKNCTESVDWNKISSQSKPVAPEHYHEYEKQAQAKLDGFTPSFFDKLFGTGTKKKQKLEQNISLAVEQDIAHTQELTEKFDKELAEWEELQNIAQGVAAKSPEGFKDALLYFDPFSDIGELGSKLQFSFTETMIDVDLHVNGSETIPDYELKQTSTGKLSKKNMTKSKLNELYQDHICSAVLRIAKESFAYLPLEHVRVNAISELLNSKTGHLEEQPILSVIIPPETLDKLNLDAIDPSDSMQNFVHNMKFVKTTGFKAVEKVELV